MKFCRILIILIGLLFISSIGFAAYKPYIVASASEVSVYPGHDFNLNVTIDSKGEVDAFDITIEVSTNTSDIIPLDKSTYFYNKISSKQQKNIVFKFAVDQDAEARIYPITIKVTFEDSSDNSYSAQSIIAAKVLDNKDPSVKVFFVDIEPKPYPTGTSKLTIDVANTASENAYYTIIKASSPVANILRDSYYVGTLNPNDVDTIDFELVFNNVTNATYPVSFDIIYKNSDDLEIIRTQTIDVNLISYEEGTRRVEETPMYYYVISIIVIILVLWFIKKMIIKKKK